MPTFYKPAVGSAESPEAISYTDEQWAVGSNMAALNYLNDNDDVRQDAEAKTLARGITPDSPEFAVTMANYGKEHWTRFGKFEGREGLGSNLLRANPGFSDLGQANAVGATPNLVYQGSTADDFIATVPRTGSNQPSTIIQNPSPPPSGGIMSPDEGGEGTTGEGTTGEGTAGEGTAGEGTTGEGTTGEGTSDGPDIASVIAGLPSTIASEVATAVANALPEQPSTPSPSIMTPTPVNTTVANQLQTEANLQPIRDDISDVSDLIGTRATGQPQTLMGQTAGIREDTTGLISGQEDITGRIGTAPTTDATLFSGQAGIQSGIDALGTAAVTNEQGEVTQKPTGLFAGQAGLMAGQTGLTQDISGIDRQLTDVGADIGDQLTGLGGQLGAFRSGVEQYQRGARTQRGDIQGTQRAGQANLLAQIQGVGQQANRAAEAIAQQRQLQTQLPQQPAVQQQAAQFARFAPRAAPNNQQVGPMGPMASDPRDVLIQNLLRNASLMNRRPV